MVKDDTYYIYCEGCKKIIRKVPTRFLIDVAVESHILTHSTHHPGMMMAGTKKEFESEHPDIDLEPDRVLITILDGIAHLKNKPAGVKVVIRDYDIQAVKDPRCKKDKNGDYYQEMIWEDTVEVIT